MTARATESVTGTAKAVLRRHGRSFHFARHFLGTRHADRAARLYAFCRHIDDLADTARCHDEAACRLDVLLEALQARRGHDPVTQDFLALQEETAMARQPAFDLVEGVRGDLRTVRITEEASLIRYAYQVAGTVGLMMCAVLDVHEPEARPFAVDLGIAMQLTNIARDVGADAALDRRYLPASWTGDLDPTQILEPGPSQTRRLRDATRRLLDTAERYYESGERGLAYLPSRARPAILIAARVYRAIGGRIAANGYRSWDRRAVVPGPAKLAHAARAMTHFLAEERFHRRPRAHDRTLHAALQGLELSGAR